MSKIIVDPIDSLIGSAHPANEPVLDWRSYLLESEIWKAAAKNHRLEEKDFNWLVDYVLAQRDALSQAKGITTRQKVQADFLNKLAEHFHFDERDHAAGWRSLHTPDIGKAMEYRESERVSDIRFLETLLDSLIPRPSEDE